MEACPGDQKGAQQGQDPRHQEGALMKACLVQQEGVQKEGVPRQEAVGQKAGVLCVDLEQLEGQQVGLPGVGSKRMRV